MSKYSFEFNKIYLIATFPVKHYDIQKYFSIKKHLENYTKKRLEQSGDKGSRKKTSYQWFETQDSIAYWDDFSKQKIVWKRVGSILRFCYDDTGIYCLDSTCFATGSNPKYLTAFFNSKMGHYLLKDSPRTGTGDLLISVQAINPIKVPLPSNEEVAYIDSLVDKIISNPSNTDNMEDSINNFFFKKYNLKLNEIESVESKLIELSL